MDNPFRISLGSLQEGIVVDRPNRFVAIVRLGQGAGAVQAMCHVADSGRLKELVYPGNAVMVRRVGENGQALKARKTHYDLVLAAFNGLHSEVDVATEPIWVSVDTRYPTRLFGQVLRACLVPEFTSFSVVRPEYPFHKLQPIVTEARNAGKAPVLPGGGGDVARKVPKSRLDFYLEGSGGPPALVEVKSVSLCVEGVGLFPDAPTERGARHLGELQKAVAMGYRAYAVFIAQREDILSVSPFGETDPKFAAALKSARDNGVRLLAYRCRVTPKSITFDPAAIPVTI